MRDRPRGLGLFNHLPPMSAMKLRKCPECGAEFSTDAHIALCCSDECKKKRKRRLQNERRKERSGRDNASLDYIKATRPVTLDTLTRARKKPENTSDVRWRIELRRRAMAQRYGAQCLDFAADPDRL